jgi:hypothetical protein
LYSKHKPYQQTGPDYLLFFYEPKQVLEACDKRNYGSYQKSNPLEELTCDLPKELERNNGGRTEKEERD